MGCGIRYPTGPSPSSASTSWAGDPGPSGWDHRWVRWPDFRTPASADDAVDALTEAYRRAASERVEIACGGGVGRTGTALAVLAVMAGVPRAEAVGWVRRHYSRRAVETPWQRRWVGRVGLGRSLTTCHERT